LPLDGARFNETLYTWMVVGGLKMEVGFLVDGLTAMMMCVVTFVSLMVHHLHRGLHGRG
jgi:NADH-quinone oxidoreductase subunit L